MVCVPCFVIPALLFIWHKFIQPYVLRFWNPWAVKDAEGNVIATEFPFNCEGGVCKFSGKGKVSSTETEQQSPNRDNTGVAENKSKAE